MRVGQWFNLRGKVETLDRVVASYQSSVASGRSRLDHFWAGLGSRRSPSVLAALVKVDLHRRFEAGERPRILEYLRAFPVLAEVSDRVVSLVYEEFCLLEERGERPDSTAFCEIYDRWRDSLKSQLVYHRELSRAVGAEPPAVDFPQPGDRFAKYHLTSVLGVGGVAKVYLATEEELGDRLIAIKVSASFGQEPTILAKLDHRNIVPIFTVATAESGLRGICMPYRPGATLEELIRKIGRKTPPRSARAIADSLRPVGAPADFPPEKQLEGWEGFPIGRTFAEAVAWIGLALADALAYLHQRGVYHRDIKPANILLAYREGPQLLDFNLAQDPSNAEGASAAQKGGTLPYMAPEQLKAFLDPRAWDDVGPTADLYSLGLVLRELLTGQPPELPTSEGSLAREIQSLLDRRLAPTPSIGAINLAVPPALESIVEKCLGLHPADRYPTAQALASDLRRFLDRKPLLVAPNTSKVELAINWAVRNRHLLLSAIVVLGLMMSFHWLLGRGQDPFQVADQLYFSSARDDWKRARIEYERLRAEHPNKAKASLGLALTLLKLKQPERVNGLLAEVVKTPEEAEPVIEERLDRERDSPTLNRILGTVFLMQNRPDRARAPIERALEIDPDSVSSLQLMASLEESEHRPREAVKHLVKAIEVVLKMKGEARLIYELRRSALLVWVNWIDANLGRTDGRAEVDSLVSELESQWHALRVDGWQVKPDETSAYPYAIAFFKGCLESIRGAIDKDEAANHFADADDRFKEARRIASAQPAANDPKLPLAAQRKKLADRRNHHTACP
jgi:serine/threonine protein kinase